MSERRTICSATGQPCPFLGCRGMPIGGGRRACSPTFAVDPTGDLGEVGKILEDVFGRHDLKVEGDFDVPFEAS